MKAVMPKDDAKLWFGVVPPDLSLITRSRTPEWVYTYLRSFYRDNKSPSGWNNIVFPNVAMPHVLYEWQGDQRAVYNTVKRKSHVVIDGNKIEKEIETEVFDRLELEKPGSMTAKEYDKAMLNLTHFLVYLGEPAKLVRYRIGIYVLIFLEIGPLPDWHLRLDISRRISCLCLFAQEGILEGHLLNRRCSRCTVGTNPDDMA